MSLIKIKKEHRVYTENTYGHNLILAPTQVGKTSNWVIPQIELWLRSPEKPNIIVTDPKSEVFSKLATVALSEGYDVKVFNLKNPSLSHHYNFLEDIYDSYMEQYLPIKNQLDFNKILSSNQPVIEYNNQLKEKGIYLDLSTVMKKINLIGDALIEEYKSGSEGNEYFKNAPRMLVKAAITYLLELSILRDSKSRFNLQSVNVFLSSEAFQITGDSTTFYDNVVKNLPSDHLVRTYYKGEDLRNLGPFLIEANKQLSRFTYNIGQLTANSDFSAQNFCQSIDPTILFVLIPTTESDSFDIAKLLVEQLTDNIIRYADRLAERKLPRRLEVVLEEMGNLPAIDKIGTYLSEGLSRNFRYSMIIQTRNQLLDKYGEYVSSIILSNTHNKIFFQNADRDEQDWISKQFNETIKMDKSTTGKQLSQINPYWHEEKDDLVNSFQVGLLDKGEALILTRNGPIESNFIHESILSPTVYQRQITDQQFFDTIRYKNATLPINQIAYLDAIKQPWS